MRKIQLLTLAAISSTVWINARASEKIDFGKDVYPILRESCLSCHAAPYEDTRGRIKKPKDGIRLDTPEWIRKGHPKDDGSWKAIVVPGDADASDLYTFTILPEDHDDIMPARGEPLTKKQTDLLKEWINQGADYGNFEAPAYVNPNSKAAQQ